MYHQMWRIIVVLLRELRGQLRGSACTFTCASHSILLAAPRQQSSLYHHFYCTAILFRNWVNGVKCTAQSHRRSMWQNCKQTQACPDFKPCAFSLILCYFLGCQPKIRMRGSLPQKDVGHRSRAVNETHQWNCHPEGRGPRREKKGEKYY